MNSHDLPFEWDFVDRRTRRRVRRGMIYGTLILLVAAIAAALLLGDSEDVHYFYQSIAVKGKAGDTRNGKEERADEDPNASAGIEMEQKSDDPEKDDNVSDLGVVFLPMQDPVNANASSEAILVSDEKAKTESLPEEQPNPVVLQPELPAEEPGNSPTDTHEPEPIEEPDAQQAEGKTERPQKHGGLAREESETAEGQVGAVEIQAGVNAPFYCLSSLDEYFKMAGRHDGRFLAWDGCTAIRIGTTLSTDVHRFEVLDSGWHRRYATRMAPLPQDCVAVQAVRKRIEEAFPKLGKNIDIALSLPYAYDHEILRAQLEWFKDRGLEVDVLAVTEGRFERGLGGRVPRFRIERVLRNGKPLVVDDPNG
jgi:hypothetical protein